MEPIRLSRLSKSASVRKIVHDDIDFPRGEVMCWNLDSQDRIVYIDAREGEVCLYLPDKYDPSNTLTIKRLYTSRHNVYIKPIGTQTIEGEEGTLVDEEDSFLNLRLFEGVWQIF
jgi:hypothetical protein